MEEKTDEMTDTNGNPTTPKLLSILERHAAGEDVVKELVSYAKKGFRGAEDSLLEAAQGGSEDARTSLTRMVVENEHYLEVGQLKQAIAACSLDDAAKQRLLELRANAGEKWALDSLKEMVPTRDQHLNLLGLTAEDSLLRSLTAKDNLWTQHVLHEDLIAMQRELLSEGDSQLERLLVRRISLCYMAVHYFECLYTDSLKTPKSARTHAVELQRMNQAHDRYISAIRALAQVRKMRLPNLQVNIGQKQINVIS